MKKDLEKRPVEKSTLDNMLSVQRRPNDKSGLGFNSNNKNKSKYNKKRKGQEQINNSAKIVCFKCKVEGHHIRSCPLKKKPLSEEQQGNRSQVQSHAQPHVEERLFPRRIKLMLLVLRNQLRRKEEANVATYVVKRATLLLHALTVPYRSEERRVGKEC